MMKILYQLVVMDRVTNLKVQRSDPHHWEYLEELYFDYVEEYPPMEYEIHIECVN